MAKNNVKREKSKETVEEDVESNELVVSGGATVGFSTIKDNAKFNEAVETFNEQVNGTTSSLKNAIDAYEKNNNELNAVKTAITDALDNLGDAEVEQSALANAIEVAKAAKAALQAAPTEPLTKEKLHTYLSLVYDAYKAKYGVVVAKYDELIVPQSP
jgi:predicted  nucleic acid-binding Zn-ribbon protein